MVNYDGMLDEPDSCVYDIPMRPYEITSDTRDLAYEEGISEEAALELEQELWDDEHECEGHEATTAGFYNGPIGETVFCDGTCKG